MGSRLGGDRGSGMDDFIMNDSIRVIVFDQVVLS